MVVPKPKKIIMIAQPNASVMITMSSKVDMSVLNVLQQKEKSFAIVTKVIMVMIVQVQLPMDFSYLYSLYL